MSKKGVSAEEKRTRMLELFYQTGECYQLKELEKVAPKLKGIVANSVKDVIQNLLDNGLIESDKIGTSIYFWSFPNKALKSKKRKLEEVTAKFHDTSKKLKTIEETIEEPEENEDKSKLNQTLSDITDLELEILSLKDKLQHHTDNDPDKFNSMNIKAKELCDAANRWTDNIFSIKSWCKNKFLMEDKMLNKQFNIPEDMDYIE